MSFHHVPCGTCFYCERRLFSQCKQYKTTGLTGGFTPNGGGFAEYVKAMPWVAERGIVALPDNVSFEEATFIEPINTIVKAVQKARITAGSFDSGTIGERASVFDGLPWSVYLPPRSAATIEAASDCHLALCSAPARVTWIRK